MSGLLLLLACGTRPDRPVPPHGLPDAVRSGVVDEDPARIVEALRPYRAEENGLAEPIASRWDRVRHQARELARARLRSERSTAYARLIVLCAGCHAGGEAPRGPVEGHGAALAALDEGLIYGDPRRLEQAVEGLARSRSLTGSYQRFLQLGRRVRAARTPAERAHFLAKLYGECIRCHGPRSPFRTGPASDEGEHDADREAG